ncbi:CPBP family intramembrane glutamic endopeptidase [Sorangium sp. So ce1097]|uniref:CPBP family intramembrane glutamic endopeptidase n=1 Tax=Sorangium sp. So ce1097 TaxID=3133330 RepID=UPI003F626B6C
MAMNAPAIAAPEARDDSLDPAGGDAARRRRGEIFSFIVLAAALLLMSRVVQRTVVPGLSPALHMAYSWGLLLALLVPVAWYVRRQSLPLARLGVTTAGLRRSLAESLAVALVLTAACFALRIGAWTRGEPLVTWGSIAGYDATWRALFFALYVPHCLLQEFVARGVIQTSLERFLPRSGRAAHLALTSAFFGVYHLHVSLGFAFLTFAIGILFGALYARHRTLAGVTLAHAALGLASVAVGLN